MNDTVQMIFGLLGGLALFLFGMNMMSESLQKAAGDRMRSVLAFLTKNPVMGVISGALVTAVLQSSSATTVMAIGFVSAGLMTLPQAISIIFGANIGTTITAQIIAFNLSDYIYIIIFAGFIIDFVAKKQNLKYIGRTILAFGLLFEGIDIMGSAMAPLAQSQVFADMIGKVADNRFLGLVTGMLMTLVVQSSSATIAVLQNIASQAGPDGVTSIIGLTGAIPVLLGDNIGTTITAILASIGQSRNAKRTALAHCIFNLSGSLLFIWFVGPYARFIEWISPKGNEIDVISRQIANAHTGFNITMTLIWTPLIYVMVKIVMKLIPDDKKTIGDLMQPKYLDYHLIGQPVSALHMASREVLHCAHIVQDMLANAEKVTGETSAQTLEVVKKDADAVTNLSRSINDYLAAIFASGTLTEDQASKATGALLMQNDVDRVSELCASIINNIAVTQTQKKHYSEDAIADMRKSLHIVREMFDEILRITIEGTNDETEILRKDRDKIMNLDEKLRKKHMKRVAKKNCDAKLTVQFNELLHDLDRIGSCCLNLSDTAMSDMNFRELIKGEPQPGQSGLAPAANIE
ncbi:MAG: Na/Pi cotransporter family protein [Lachnospiraceae bacterium]|jgi:phosphate:Na+ symporter